MTGCNRLTIVTALITIFCISNNSPVIALQEDSRQPVYIHSDRAQRDNKKNITVYESNVELTQGGLKILADKITVYDKNGSIGKIIATGQPAHYRQQPIDGKGDLIAKANSIEFEFEKEHILLRGNASVYQDGSTITSEVINYDIRSAVMKADSDDRVRIVIPPNNNK